MPMPVAHTLLTLVGFSISVLAPAAYADRARSVPTLAPIDPSTMPERCVSIAKQATAKSVPLALRPAEHP